MLFLIGTTITFFLELLLLSKKHKSLPDKLLAIWLAFMGIHLFLFFLRYTGSIYNTPFLLGLELPFPFIHGAFLIIYVRTLTRQMPGKKSLLLLYFIPVIFSYLLFYPFFLLESTQKIITYQQKGFGFENRLSIHFIAIIILSMLYILHTVHLLKQHRKNIKNLFSATEKNNLKWLGYLTYGLGILYLISFLMDEIYVFSLLVIFVHFIGFMGIRQVDIFTQAKSNESFLPVDNKPVLAGESEEKPKYAKSGLSHAKANEIYQELQVLMQKEELFAISNITLAQLAERINVHPNYLSQIINDKTGGNFYAFINNLRIEKFMQLLQDPRNRKIKIISLAYDCGFNSKSSFHKYFKNKIGLTPGEYLTKLNNNDL